MNLTTERRVTDHRPQTNETADPSWEPTVIVPGPIGHIIAAHVRPAGSSEQQRQKGSCKMRREGIDAPPICHLAVCICLQLPAVAAVFRLQESSIAALPSRNKAR